jgi:MYXO-CTERM domain-containing protein
MKTKVHLLIAIVFAAGCVAKADTIFSSESAWDTVVSGITDINFSGVSIPSGFLNEPSTGFTQGGATFLIGPAGSDNVLFLLAPGIFSAAPVNIVSAQSTGTASTPVNDLEIQLPSSETAVGFMLYANPGTITVTLSDGTTTTQSPTSSSLTPLFFGFTAPGGITSIDISEPFSSAAESVNLSDLFLATANPTTTAAPEPRLAIVLAAMLGLVAFAAHRRRQTVS